MQCMACRELAHVSACRLTREISGKEQILSLFLVQLPKASDAVYTSRDYGGKNTSQSFSWQVHREGLSLSQCHHSHPETGSLITFHMA